VPTAPLTAPSLATFSTIAASSAVTSASMTFIERPAMFQVTSAMPSWSTSKVKLLSAIDLSLRSVVTPGPSNESSVRLARLVQIARARGVALDLHVDVRIERTLVARARADLQEHGVAPAAIDPAIAVGGVRLPAGGVARLEQRLAVVLAQGELAFEHVDELVFGLMPVTLRRPRARLQGGEVDAELVEPDCIAQPLAPAAAHRLAIGLGI